MTVVLVERISAVHRDNYGIYGVRKMWHALRREGIDIGREQTARLMRLAGVSGKGTGGSPITTRKANVPDLRPDLVEREFKAQGLKHAVGGRYYLCAREERLCVCRVCHRRLLPERVLGSLCVRL
ncbi:IS3 family transposase [Corynebacterium sp. KPL4015]|uniref:IS3 family transposase n=1 Tax=Corynebacterium sp. KPL4015 TaxID=3158326 RepID=UPI0032EBA327